MAGNRTHNHESQVLRPNHLNTWWSKFIRDAVAACHRNFICREVYGYWQFVVVWNIPFRFSEWGKWTELKGLRQFRQVSWTAKKTNERVLDKAGVKRELLDTVKARKLAYYGHTMSKQGSCLEKETMQGTMPGARRRGRPHTAWMDNIKTWTGLP